MTPMAPTAPTCDHPTCPAPGPHTLLIHDQDFHFCGHHRTQLQRSLDTATITGTWFGGTGGHTEVAPLAPRVRPAALPQGWAPLEL